MLTLGRIRRLGGAAGIGFVVMALVAVFLPGSPPKADDEVAKIGTYFTDKHGEILASSYLLGIAFGLFLLFAAGLRLHLGAASPAARPGSAALAGAVVGTAMIFAGSAVLNGAVFQVADARDPVLNHALYDVSSDLFAMAGFGFAVFFVGAALAGAGTGALPAWFMPAGLVVALINLVSSIALFAKSGFFAIGGAFGFVAPLASLLWVLAASVVLLRFPAEAAAAQPAAPAATRAGAGANSLR